MPAETEGSAASDQPPGDAGAVDGAGDAASAAAAASPGGERSDSPTRKKKKKKKPAPKKPAAKGKDGEADAAAAAADSSPARRGSEEEGRGGGESREDAGGGKEKAEVGGKGGDEDEDGEGEEGAGAAAAAAQPSEGVVAAAVAAALAALASASPEPASVPFLLQVSASFAGGGADGVRAYAVVSFGGRTPVRRTSSQTVRGRRGVAWDGEWLPAAAAVEGCRVCVQVLTDEGVGADGDPRLLLGTEHVVRRAAVLRCRTVDKVWGLPCGDLGTIRLTCRAGTAADAAAAATAAPPTVAAGGGAGGRHHPAAARGGGTAAPLGEGPGSRERGAAGRRLFAFFRAHGGEARLRGIPAMLNAYTGREGDLIEAHKLAHPWWDWDRDPVEVGDWARRIIPRQPHVFAAEPVSQAEAYGSRPRAAAQQQQQQHNSPKVI